MLKREPRALHLPATYKMAKPGITRKSGNGIRRRLHLNSFLRPVACFSRAYRTTGKEEQFKIDSQIYIVMNVKNNTAKTMRLKCICQERILSNIQQF